MSKVATAFRLACCRMYEYGPQKPAGTPGGRIQGNFSLDAPARSPIPLKTIPWDSNTTEGWQAQSS
jgi:hypothetical protein